MKARATHGHGQERRRYPRKGSFLRAQLQTPAGDFECLVMNLSPRGANIEIDYPLGPHQSVTLILEPLGEFSGSVAWRHDNYVGMQINDHRTTRNEITLTRRSAQGMP
jgi:PilZ domain